MSRLALPALVWSLFLLSAPALHAGSRPGIVVILADDLGWGDPRCYNAASKIPTPNIDRLASEGMRFTDAHSPSAVCSPTRYGILTGRYAWRTRMKSGVLFGYSPPLIEPDRPTLATFLRGQGYATACVGKWHLGLEFTTHQPAQFGDGEKPAADPTLIDWTRPLKGGPHTAGFDEFFGIPASLDMVPYLFLENDRIPVPPTNRITAGRHQRQGGPGFWREGPIAPGFTMTNCQPELTRHAVDFLRRQHAGRPFFLYFPLTSPHDPWVPIEDFRGRSTAGPRGDFVAQVDDTVGQVLAMLDRRGLARDTVVVFTSDNGAHWLPREVADTGHAANGPWRGMKSDAFEGGHRIPLIVRWPGRVRPGSTSDALVGLNDLFATLAEITGRRLPAGAAPDSVSFLSALRGHPVQPRARTPLVLHSIRGNFVLRDGPWKLIDAADSGGWTDAKATTAAQLYDLGSDPAEEHNRFAEDRARAVRMRRVLDVLREAKH